MKHKGLFLLDLKSDFQNNAPEIHDGSRKISKIQDRPSNFLNIYPYIYIYIKIRVQDEIGTLNTEYFVCTNSSSRRKTNGRRGQICEFAASPRKGKSAKELDYASEVLCNVPMGNVCRCACLKLLVCMHRSIFTLYIEKHQIIFMLGWSIRSFPF